MTASAISELLAAALLAGGSLLLLATGVRDALEGHASRRWPAAPGQILAAGIVGEESRDRDEPDLRRAVVEYAYTVAGRWYVGNRVCAGGLSVRGLTGGLHPRLWRYQLEPSVTVYYDPARPHRAVLEQGVSARACSSMLLGASALTAVALLWPG